MIIAITGGAGALGSAVATHLASHGHRVAILDTTSAQSRADALVARLGSDKALAVLGDFAEPAVWSGALAKIREAFGSLPSRAALVAGGWDGGVKVADPTSTDVLRKMMRTNVDTVQVALGALLPGMLEAKAGSIVVIGSRAVARPWTSAGAAAYAASKAAVVALARAAAAEVLGGGVRINAVSPSTLDTPANREAMPGADFGAWVSLDAAARTIGFLLSDDARDISGVDLPLDGRA